MPWWGWILVGAMLLGSELFVTTEFYLAVFGVAAMATGVLAVALDLEVWPQWAAFAVLAVVFLVFFRSRIWKLMDRGGVGKPVDRVVGESVIVSQRIEAGATGRAQLRGAVWSVRNVGQHALEPDDSAYVQDMDGLTLKVRGDAKPADVNDPEE